MKYHLILLLLILPFRLIAQENNQNKKTFYNDNVLAIEEWFGKDNKKDSLKSYYKTGELNEDIHYNNGKLNGYSFQYNKKGEKLTTWSFKDGKLLNRTDHIIEFNKKTKEEVQISHQRLKTVNKQLKGNPDDFRLKYLRARELAYLNNTTLAYDEFIAFEKQLINTKNPKNKNVPTKLIASILDYLANIYAYYEIENYALHYKYAALKKSPTESRLYYNLGSYLVATKSNRLGIEYLNKAIEMRPKHRFANWGLARAYYNLAEYEKALSCINIVLEREDVIYSRGNRTNTENNPRTIRGFLYYKLGDTDKAIMDLEEALDINSENTLALRHLGIIYHDLGKFSESCELLKKAKTLGYEKTYDMFDLDDYLENACNNRAIVSKTDKTLKKPYIYPNPAKTNINIKNFNFENFSYSIYNFESNLIKTGNATNTTIDISELPEGFYIIKCATPDKVFSFKTIKD